VLVLHNTLVVLLSTS